MLPLLVLTAVFQCCLGSGIALPHPQSSVEAHGPLARLALHSMARYYPSASPLQVAPAVEVSAPVAALHHIPVTKYSTYPGYIQRFVDVPTAQIAKAKLQVRRPAIHKQFYDIEKHTVVRPIGSAVVELDEPLSKNLVSPFSVVPGGYPPLAQYQPVAAYPSSQYPFVSYAPFQTPVHVRPPLFVQQTPVVAQYPQPPPRPVLAPQAPPQYPTLPPRPQQPQPLPQPSNPSTENVETNEEFDDSDTVVIENPEFARASANKDEQNNVNNNLEDAEQPVAISKEKSIENDDTARSMDIINEFQNRQLLRQFLRNNDFQPLQTILPAQQRQDNLAQSKSSEKLQEPSSEVETKVEDKDISELPQNFLRASVIPPSVGSSQLRTYYSEGQIASVRNLSPEQYQDNQRKLIELLTGRGEVADIDISRSGVKTSSIGDAGIVRGRVVSVTSAPDQGQGTERVSTRRVVVSRPIQTLEEVDVQQPVTRLEKVAVHEPTVLSTAVPFYR